MKLLTRQRLPRTVGLRAISDDEVLRELLTLNRGGS